MEGLVVRVSGEGAEISWPQSSCLPGFELVVAREDSCDAACLDSNQTERLSLPPPGDSLELDVVYFSWHRPEGGLRLRLASLAECSDYVVMVRLSSDSGLVGPVTSQVFRAESSSESSSESVITFSDQKWLPPVSSLRVVAGISSASVDWRQPGCQEEYELLVVETGDQCGDSYQCLQARQQDIRRGSQEEQGGRVSLSLEKLTSCTQYRVIVRSKGRSCLTTVESLSLSLT